MSHTLVLLQGSNKASSKQYSDYESVELALDGICQLYEYQLKNSNNLSGGNSSIGNSGHLTYDISDLFKFVDDLPDLACLVYADELAAYVPHDKNWIKTQIYIHLKRQAEQQ